VLVRNGTTGFRVLLALSKGREESNLLDDLIDRHFLRELPDRLDNKFLLRQRSLLSWLLRMISSVTARPG